MGETIFTCYLTAAIERKILRLHRWQGANSFINIFANDIRVGN